MNQVQIGALSRRVALQRGLGAITGVALVGIAGSSAWAAEPKLAKTTVQYVDAGKDEGKDCNNCAQFLPGKTEKDNGTCKIVDGTINPRGHCIAFTPKPTK